MENAAKIFPRCRTGSTDDSFALRQVFLGRCLHPLPINAQIHQVIIPGRTPGFVPTTSEINRFVLSRSSFERRAGDKSDEPAPGNDLIFAQLHRDAMHSPSSQVKPGSRVSVHAASLRAGMAQGYGPDGSRGCPSGAEEWTGWNGPHPTDPPPVGDYAKQVQ